MLPIFIVLIVLYYSDFVEFLFLVAILGSSNTYIHVMRYFSINSVIEKNVYW